jgi:hypothetical protein
VLACSTARLVQLALAPDLPARIRRACGGNKSQEGQDGALPKEEQEELESLRFQLTLNDMLRYCPPDRRYEASLPATAATPGCRDARQGRSSIACFLAPAFIAAHSVQKSPVVELQLVAAAWRLEEPSGHFSRWRNKQRLAVLQPPPLDTCPLWQVVRFLNQTGAWAAG